MFLNSVRKDHVQITIYLINGYQLKGFVKASYNYTIILESDNNKQQLVYKHAISTISPIKQVDFSNINE